MTNANPVTKAFDIFPAHRSSARFAELARQALVAEAELTPKPGLVDRRGSGSHTDLSLELMRRSAAAIAPYFAAMATVSSTLPIGLSLRASVAAIGRDAESAMLRKTGGSNAHKGAIWVLGLLVTAANQTDDLLPASIAANAGVLARLPDRARPQVVSHGDLVRNRYGAAGARGEAYAGFPHIVDVGLPALRDARRRGCSEAHCRLSSLLLIMTHLEDTCVLYRGGREGLAIVMEGARGVLAAGGPESLAGKKALHRFDRELISRRISPGGSADLLAATLFLDALERGQQEIERDNSLSEKTHGAY
jgi:triphosphoribosyl-dephospho-CoA synthase